MPRFRLLAPVVVLVLGACGSVRTELPATVEPAPPLEGERAQTTAAADSVIDPAGSGGTAEPTSTELAVQPAVTVPVQPAVTASPYKSPGEKHPVPGGTLAVSYPRVGVRPPQGVAPAPAGQAWAVVNVRFCADPATAIAGTLVDPARFRIEVPGQGVVVPAPGAPALARAPLAPGGPGVAPGACVEGSVAYLVAGEGHVEAVTYDSGAGLLRWAT